MIYKGIDIERRECTFIPGPHLRLCGYDYDYGMFRTKHPRDHAVSMIHEVFSDEEIKGKRFIYVPRTYRGRQSMQDTLTVYYQKKTRY